MALQVDRHERNTGEHAEKDLAPVLQNSLAWGGFLALSSNTRYQLVAGIEERVLVRPPPLSCFPAVAAACSDRRMSSVIGNRFQICFCTGRMR